MKKDGYLDVGKKDLTLVFSATDTNNSEILSMAFFLFGLQFCYVRLDIRLGDFKEFF